MNKLREYLDLQNEIVLGMETMVRNYIPSGTLVFSPSWFDFVMKICHRMLYHVENRLDFNPFRFNVSEYLLSVRVYFFYTCKISHSIVFSVVCIFAFLVEQNQFSSRIFKYRTKLA